MEGLNMLSRILAALTLVPVMGIVACTPATRALGPVDSAGGPPKLYGVEREIRDGVLTLPGNEKGDLKRRVAVVIGNSAYAHVSKLDNPRNDARAMATLLKKNGFQVVQGQDVGKRSFERLLRNAVRAGGPGAELVAFYAGHGFQIGSKNFLVPVDANLKTANDLPFHSVRLRSLLRILGQRSDKHLSFLDSCRNNPFPGTDAKTGVTRGTGTTAIGFSEPRVPSGGFVAYATKPGALAYDGDGSNSPFTAALLRNVRSRPNESIVSTLRRVRSSVRSATRGEQIPTWTSRLNEGFAFELPKTGVARLSPNQAAAGTTAPPRPARPAASPAAAPLPQNRPTVTVDAPMEKVVAAGGRIAEKLNLPDDASVTIVRPPENGTIGAIDKTATLTETAPAGVKVADAGSLIYVAPPEQKPATGSAAGNAVTDSMVVAVKLPNAPPTQVNVNLRLTPDPCDVEAGDFLDLQGVGVYRRDKRMSPKRAIGACAAAVRNDPTNARFKFQLGKALEADGQFQKAVNVYEEASAAGHIRADHALGQIALQVPGQEPIGMIYFRRCASNGDPYCAQALGKLLLGLARTEAEREEAFELLAFAVDLGLPDAMRTLAAHFDNPTSPDFDPERAAVFAREAVTREGGLPVIRPATGTTITEDVDLSGPGGESPADSSGDSPSDPNSGF